MMNKRQVARRLSASIAIVVGMSAGAMTAPGAALAVTCSPSSHCYAIANWNNATTNMGSAVTLYTDCLNGPNDSSNFADEGLLTAAMPISL
jgi:hypothetical protein